MRRLSSQRASNCVFVFGIATDASENQTTDVSALVLYVCVCFKIRNNLTIVQQGYMPFISARLQYFLLYLVMLHKFMPTV